MGVIEIVTSIVLIAIAVFIVALVTMQEGNSGLGVLTGQTGEQTGKNHARTMNAMLSRATKVVGFVLIVLTLVVTMVNAYL